MKSEKYFEMEKEAHEIADKFVDFLTKNIESNDSDFQAHQQYVDEHVPNLFHIPSGLLLVSPAPNTQPMRLSYSIIVHVFVVLFCRRTMCVPS